MRGEQSRAEQSRAEQSILPAHSEQRLSLLFFIIIEDETSIDVLLVQTR